MKLRNSAPFRSHTSISVVLSVVLFTHFAAPSASATPYFWDNDGTTPGFGTAAGTWADPTTGDASQGWSTDGTGVTLPANVTTTTSDTLNFGNTTTGLATGLIAITGTVNANQVVFAPSSGAIALSGGTIGLGGTSPSISAQNQASVIGSAIALSANSTISYSRNSAAGGLLTVNGLIDGSNNLTFNTPNVNSGGNVQLIVLGSANTYSGNTTITTGNGNNALTVRAGVANALPTTTVLTLNGGNGVGSGRQVAYDLNGFNQAIAGLTNTTGLSLRTQRILNTGSTATSLTINNTANFTFSGNINGTGINLTKTGVGTQTLVSGNAYNGTTTISGGKLQGVVGGNCASSKLIVSNASASFSVSITDNTKTWRCAELAPTAAGAMEFNFGAELPSPTVSPLTITGLADFTAATPPVSVVVTTGLLPGTYPLMTWGSTSGTAPTTPDLTVSTIAAGTSASLEISGSTLNLVITSTLTTVVKANNADNLNLGSSWVGAVAPDANTVAKWNSTVTSANTTVLGADVTWAGISIENPNGPVSINAGNSLTLGAAIVDIDLSTTPATPADLTLACPLTLSAANFWDVADTRTLTLGGQVSGPFGINKLGAGMAILSSAANSYTGDTAVSAGTLQLGASNVIPNGTLIGNVVVDGTLDLNGKDETVNGLSGAGIIDNLAAATTSNLTVGTNSQTSTFSGNLKNSGSTATLNFAKTGSGALTLSGANTFTGSTTVSDGTLTLGHASALSGTSGITLAGGTTLASGLSGININKPITLGATGTTVTITAPGVAGSGTTNFPVTLSGGIGGDGNVSFSGISSTNAYGVINLNAACNYAGSTLITTISNYGGGAPNNANIFMNLGVANALPVTTVVTLDGGDGGGTAPGRFCELDLNGKNQTLAGLTNVTGRVSRVQRLVNNSATAATLTLNNDVDYTYSGQLGWVSGYGSTAYNNFNLTKSGGGVQTLSGALRYAGNTTVNGGKLSLGSTNANNDLSTVTIAASGATLELTYAGTDTVNKFFIGASQQPAGTYGHTSSGATNGGLGVGALDAYFATGTGTLTVVGGYSSWQAANSTAQTINLDHDNDGVSNGIEYFLGGNTNTTGFTALPGVTNTAGTLSITWTKAASYTGTYGTDFVVETSSTLAGAWAAETLGVTVTITGNDVKYTFPAGTKNFARLKVTGP